jgi:3-hydroxyisobutyrate dehydrogenase
LQSESGRRQNVEPTISRMRGSLSAMNIIRKGSGPCSRDGLKNGDRRPNLTLAASKMSSSKPALAFAGLGAMGFGMAAHLVKSGFPVVGYDVYAPAMQKLVAAGGKSSKTPRDVAQEVEFFVCMVANSIQATPLLFDSETGAVGGLKKDATIIMCSTVAPAYIAELRSRLDDIGRADVRLIDAPVSGGAARAANGTLSIFSSGREPDLANAHAILDCMAGKLYNVPGGIGAGSNAKLIHQIFAGINIAMASEAMGLAAAAGLDTQKAFDYLKESEGNSWMFSNRVPYMLNPGSPPYSAITIIAKDVAIITSTSRAKKFPLPLLSTAEQLYLTGISAGWGKEDDCVIVRLYLPGRGDLVAKQAGVPTEASTASLVTVETVKDLMVGVHLAAVAETMKFSEHLGLDTDLVYDIVSNAAGASAAFVMGFEEMRRGGWSLKSFKGVSGVRDRLVRFSRTIHLVL